MNVKAKRELQRRIDLPVELSAVASAEAAATEYAGGASAAIVNRTHRIVRERARSMQARRSTVRSLWVPLAMCSGLLLVICTAIWTILDEYESSPTGIPDASQQMFVLIMWFLPLSAVLLAMVWFKRTGTRAESGNAQ